jgi:hypothetical protein
MVMASAENSKTLRIRKTPHTKRKHTGTAFTKNNVPWNTSRKITSQEPEPSTSTVGVGDDEVGDAGVKLIKRPLADVYAEAAMMMPAPLTPSKLRPGKLKHWTTRMRKQILTR